MRDYNAAFRIPKDAEYKEVLIIGNGPSGIAMSYLLSGNWPYYNGKSHPDDFLYARLQAIKPERSFIQQDLLFLSQGLEGRSRNPVSLLMDALNYPYADIGMELPSLVKWKNHPEKLVDHLVLGKGPPGGAWQVMDRNVLTISLASWMELPGLDFRHWEAEVNGNNGVSSCRNSRASVSSVARYYSDYVKIKGLTRFFRNNSTVTSVRQLDASLLLEDSSFALKGKINPRDPIWCVEGIDSVTQTHFCYLCSKLVLATGSTDAPNRLGIPGELTNPRWVVHDLVSLEMALDRLQAEANPVIPLCSQYDPVLVVGAGLSAADAVISARFRMLPVLHLFRNKRGYLDRQLPENMYPEYHKVHQMMNDGGVSYSGYASFPEHSVVEIGPDHKVTVARPG